MKKVFCLCLVFALTLLMTACGGGGGGGGGSGGGGMVSLSTIYANDSGVIPGDATPADVAEITAESAAIQAKLTGPGGYAIAPGEYAIDTNGSLRLLDISTPSNVIEVFKMTNAEIHQYEFEKNGVASKFLGGEGIILKRSFDEANPYGPTSPSLNGETFVGDIETQAVFFVGQLEYSLFGWWSVKNYMTGELSNEGRVVNAFLADGEKGDMFFNNLTDNGAYLAPASNARFVGIALAEAHSMSKPFAGLEVGNEKIVALVGEAELDVNSATMGKLALNFDGFYNFDAALVLAGSQIDNGSQFTAVHENNNTTGITLDTNIASYTGHNFVSGDFQGALGGSVASEASGEFILSKWDTASNSGVTFQGAFGVKERQ
jgi:hypothetical protein